MRLRERLQRLMYGRYGHDKLGLFCFISYFVIYIITLFFRGTNIAYVLYGLSYLLIIAYFFRFLSKNIYKRQRENQKFLEITGKIKNYFKYLKMKVSERNGVKKLYRCPKCHQVIRVPKGRGKIAITCPKCRFEFIKKT